MTDALVAGQPNTATQPATSTPAPAVGALGALAPVLQQPAPKPGTPPPAQPAADAGKPSDPQATPNLGAPDKYEFKAPAGNEFDPKVLEAFSGVAKELNLSQVAAQKMLDTVGPALQARAAEQAVETRNAWAEAAKVDKEIGGAKFAENLATANQALSRFGSPELVQLLKESGLCNHPEVIRAWFKAGKAISQDVVLGSATPTPAADGQLDFKGFAKAFYGKGR